MCNREGTALLLIPKKGSQNGRYLVDTSVLARAHQAPIGDRLEDLAASGPIWTCRLIDFGVRHACRSAILSEPDRTFDS